MPIPFFLDGVQIEALEEETILQAAARCGIDIPHLCYADGLRADGNCRACVVEIEGERALQPACTRKPSANMVVHLAKSRVQSAQKVVLELLLSDVPESRDAHCELHDWAGRLGVEKTRFPSREQPDADLSHPAITVQLDACIQCTRCVRACREIQNNDVIAYAQRGSNAEIVFDLGDPMGASSCVGCGECVSACPTGALQSSSCADEEVREVDSVCPYCGVGCLLTWRVRNDRIIEVTGRDGPSNHGRLCVKGRYGYDYAYHPDRLTEPLIRREDAPREFDLNEVSAEEIRQWFRPANWEEALGRAANGFLELRQNEGPDALAGFGSAKGTNEEAYLFQKLVRCAFRNNHVDHCTRLCHASSVAALLSDIGSSAVSNPVSDVAYADTILVIGANPTDNHPVAATFMKNAAHDGKTLIVMDPRRTDLARHADLFLQFNPDTDVALLNAILYTIIEQGWTDAEFVKQRVDGYETLAAHVQDYAPERIQALCGVDAQQIREAARLFATASASMIFWGMGISQHIHGTDNARCLIALSLITGQIGRRGTGLHPLRGQNNVQGASDAGLIPMVYPGYQRIDSAQAQTRFEELWSTPLDPNPGLTVVEIMQAALDEKIKGMYIMGENPAMSDPNLHHVRSALGTLQHLVVQDLFLTETAAYADVVLPASAAMEKTGTYTNTDRRVQLGRPAHSPPGEAQQDLWIIQQIARRMGLDWPELEARDVFEEMRQCMDTIRGISWERLDQEGSVTYPCTHAEDPGQEVIFRSEFPTESGRANLVPAPFTQAAELPDQDYPYILITGRLLEHWHTGSMTRRAGVLNALEPEAVAFLSPSDADKLELMDGERVAVHSRRGTIECAARTDPGLIPGQIFIPFCYREAAANLLTHEELDPLGKIPEFKFCAVQLETTVSPERSLHSSHEIPPARQESL